MKNNIKSILSFLVLTTILFFACEKDDFCTRNPVTPQLILRFYDNVNRETLKTVDNLYVWAEGKDTIFNNVSLDSLYIPLNPIESETVYHFSNGVSVDTFTIQYNIADEYVSRSCGYRVIYNDVTFSSNNAWINDFSASSPLTIENQSAAHVQIYH